MLERQSCFRPSWRYCSRGPPWGLLSLPFFWLAVVLISAARTVAGDFISGRDMLGLPVSAAVTAALFIAVLVIWREQSSPERGIAIAS